jgi:hypothetical protein
MVPSELTRVVNIRGLLVFLGCWNWGPYVDPDQQGDTPLKRSRLALSDGVLHSVI